MIFCDENEWIQKIYHIQWIISQISNYIQFEEINLNYINYILKHFKFKKKKNLTDSLIFPSYNHAKVKNKYINCVGLIKVKNNQVDDVKYWHMIVQMSLLNKCFINLKKEKPLYLVYLTPTK